MIFSIQYFVEKFCVVLALVPVLWQREVYLLYHTCAFCLQRNFFHETKIVKQKSPIRTFPYFPYTMEANLRLSRWRKLASKNPD